MGRSGVEIRIIGREWRLRGGQSGEAKEGEQRRSRYLENIAAAGTWEKMHLLRKKISLGTVVSSAAASVEDRSHVGRDPFPLNENAVFSPRGIWEFLILLFSCAACRRWMAAGAAGLLVFGPGPGGARAAEGAAVCLPASNVVLTAPDGWTVRSENGEASISPPEQPDSRLRRRIHLSLVAVKSPSLEEAAIAEIERITQRAPKWGSSNDWRSFKGCVPVRTESGISGIRAGFWEDSPQGHQFSIVKYYFRDEKGRIFRVCAHIYGGETDFVRFESAILKGLGPVPTWIEEGQ